MWWLLFRKINARHVAVAQGAALLIVILYALNQHDRMRTYRAELATARASVENPAKVEVVRTVYREGPIRIKTVVIERAGEKTTDTTEDRGETVAVTTTDTESLPVALPDLLPAPPGRENRVLVGLDLRDWRTREIEAYTLYGGYSWINRVDLLAGVGRRDNRTEGHLMLIGRF